MAHKTHGHGMRSPTYRTWVLMKQRCFNPKHPYFHNYGLRGITICTKWIRFEGFLEDMGTRPPSMTLDRKDNFKGYCRENCRWATRQEQAKNRKTTRFITINGETLCMSEWEVRFNLAPGFISQRIANGWDAVEAATTPSLHSHYRPRIPNRETYNKIRKAK